jgi:tetratricopeptide (TPR) repeat protein
MRRVIGCIPTMSTDEVLTSLSESVNLASSHTVRHKKALRSAMKNTILTAVLTFSTSALLFGQDGVELAAPVEPDSLDKTTSIPEVETVNNPDLEQAADLAGNVAPSEKMPEIKRKTPDPTSAELAKVPPTERQVLSNHMQRASVFVRGIRLQEALDELFQAEAVTNKYKANFYQLYNLKGAVYTKMREFGQSRTAFQKAIELDPESFHPQFNLAELEFVEKNWVAAEKAFAKLVERYGNKPLGEDLEIELTTERLMQFKVVICMLMQGREEDALAIVKKFGYLEDNPAYYYGNAAVEFSKEKKEEAQTWLESARRIYEPSLLEVFVDSFVEVGWVETL